MHSWKRYSAICLSSRVYQSSPHPCVYASLSFTISQFHQSGNFIQVRLDFRIKGLTILAEFQQIKLTVNILYCSCSSVRPTSLIFKESYFLNFNYIKPLGDLYIGWLYTSADFIHWLTLGPNHSSKRTKIFFLCVCYLFLFLNFFITHSIGKPSKANPVSKPC